MNALTNSVRLLGNVGMDPQVLTFDNGNKLAKFSLATTEKKRNPEGSYEDHTTWHNLAIWGKGADIIETYIHKGDKMAIEGRINYRQYEDKNGNKRYATEIVVNDFTMLGGPNEKKPAKKTRSKTKEKADLPF